MADHRYIATLWAGTESAVRRSADAAFRYLLRNLKLGPAEDQEIAGNFGGIWYEATTSSVANQEFSVAHQQNQIPTMILPGMPLNSSGVQWVPLTISRPADANRIYLRSGTTGATIWLYCEFGGL